MVTTWQVLINNSQGVHSPEDFRTRREAEVFAAARSYWRQDGSLFLVRRVGADRWTSSYRGGRLHDANVLGSYRPRGEYPALVLVG